MQIHLIALSAAGLVLRRNSFYQVFTVWRGNAAQMKTPTAYSGSTSRREWICRTFIKTDSTPLQDNLTNVREKRYNSVHQQRYLQNVLHRPAETTTLSSHWIFDSRMSASHKRKFELSF
jgi:hypothetical protein